MPSPSRVRPGASSATVEIDPAIDAGLSSATLSSSVPSPMRDVLPAARANST
jgi:hypothetical protein